jgi:hypothetical protein
MRKHLPFTIAALALAGSAVLGCRQAAPPPAPTGVELIPAAAILSDPADPAWTAAPEFVAPLLPQDLVEPRKLQPSTAEVRVRAISDGKQMAFRLEWTDDSSDDRPGPAEFSDACAVQLPARIEPTLPAPQMGEKGHPVEITFWTAAWQATVDGRSDSIQALYPNASVDHYPFQAKPLEKDPRGQQEMATRYAPALALGNRMAGPRPTPVQDLIAEGPGTLTPAAAAESTGRGQRTATGWSVVIARRLPAGLSPATGSQIALAVWEGTREEVGARKMRTGWINLTMRGQP